MDSNVIVQFAYTPLFGGGKIIHNWLDKFQDGLIAWDQRVFDTFRSFMPPLTQDGRREWRGFVGTFPGERSPGRYCQETYKTTGMVLEFPWYNRSVGRMREIGVESFKTFVHTGLELFGNDI